MSVAGGAARRVGLLGGWVARWLGCSVVGLLGRLGCSVVSADRWLVLIVIVSGG